MKINTGHVFFLFITLCSMVVNASFGGKIDSVEADGKVLKGNVQALKPGQSKAFRKEMADLFTVYEIDTGGVKVREYVSQDGVVFGVAWQGLAHPDLKQLLASYHQQFETADKATPRFLGMRRRGVKSADIRVDRWGHQRNLRGRAVHMSLLPSGVTVDEIQ